MVAATAVLYGVVVAGTRVPLRHFARACAPAQVVALSTHSSAASLPTMLDGAERLHLRSGEAGFVLPLSLALFKYSSPVWFIVTAFFVSRLYGVPITDSRLVPMVLIAVATSFAVGGVPSGAAVMAGPVLIAAGLPIEAMGLILAVDPLPNSFRTVANVTGMLTVAALSCSSDTAGDRTAMPPGPHPDPDSPGFPAQRESGADEPHQGT